MQKWWFSDRISHAGIWLLYFLLSWAYYYSWLPLNDIYVSPLRLFVFTVTTVCLTLAFPYFLYWFRKRYSEKWPYLVRILVHGLLMVIASMLLSLVDAAYLIDKPAIWLLDAWHLTSRVPTLLILSLIINWMRMRRDFEAHKKQQVQLENARQEAELRMLKAQISPHFLFNALNNLNSLIHLDPARASHTVVQLSELLRHVIYEGHQQKITLENEIAYLRNYVALSTMKERLLHQVVVETDIEPGYVIEPLILVNFVENVFKHGRVSAPDEFIRIRLTAGAGIIRFTCSNPYQASDSKDTTHGIGLTNVRARLALAYPEKHRLNITQQQGIYTIELELNSR